jgi:hypothetical protein
MNRLLNGPVLILGATLLVLIGSARVALGQTSSFTYQGRLTDGGTAATGNYDFQFGLWDSASGGAQIGSTLTLNSVAVSNGVFNVSLDFGASSFNGASRFLEISARPISGGAFTLLSPRQQVTSTPYAVRSVTASTADTATTATNATQLGGVAASQYVQTNDSRLTDARSPLAGSASYIQNATVQQASTNFNISGSGAAGGSLTGGSLIANSGVGIGTASFLRPSSLQFSPDINAAFTISANDGAPNAGYIRFGDKTGWRLHFARNRESSGGALNTGTTGVLMTLQDNGNVGIGNAGPTFRLHVLDASNTGLRVQTNTSGGTVASFGGFGDFQIDAVNVPGGRLTVKESGNVGIGLPANSAPQTKLDVRGDVKLGSTGQLFAAGGEENLRILRGNLDQAGNIDAGSGFTASRSAVGFYNVQFNTPFSATPTVTANCRIFLVNGICNVTPVTVNTQTATFFVFNSTNNFTDALIFFTVIGPR